MKGFSDNAFKIHILLVVTWAICPQLLYSASSQGIFLGWGVMGDHSMDFSLLLPIPSVECL